MASPRRGWLLALLLSLPLAGRAIAAEPPSAPPAAVKTFTSADYERHIAALKPKLPGGQFTVVLTPPFVVIGDEMPEVVRSRARRTVRWAVEHLKSLYFTQDPDEILDIWLFRDKTSYEANAQKLFGAKPDTPYGYFSDADGALVMNIATGSGTLVHEIVHPFVAANFPKCPAWFNEGLASLYEQSGEEDGRIHGYTNWRLAGLQKAIRGHHLGTFQRLCETTSDQFYKDDRGTNYAQARYLCYYLQQQDRLTDFYRRFRDNVATDPTGYATLQAVLGEEGRDMPAFQQKWEAFVLKLKFPDR